MLSNAPLGHGKLEFKCTHRLSCITCLNMHHIPSRYSQSNISPSVMGQRVRCFVPQLSTCTKTQGFDKVSTFPLLQSFLSLPCISILTYSLWPLQYSSRSIPPFPAEYPNPPLTTHQAVSTQISKTFPRLILDYSAFRAYSTVRSPGLRRVFQ